MVENCSDCIHFERGFLSEPNTCGWFKSYVNVPQQGIPVWCPKQHELTTRKQLIGLYTLEWVRKDHLRRTSELQFFPNAAQICKEDIAKLIQLVYPYNPTRADLLKEALTDHTNEKIDKLWEQELSFLKGNK